MTAALPAASAAGIPKKTGEPAIASSSVKSSSGTELPKKEAVVFPLKETKDTAGYHVNANYLANGPGPISNPKTYFANDLHVGTDFKAAAGDPVFAPISGSIVYYHTKGNATIKDNPEQTFVVLRGDDGRDYVLGHVKCAVCKSDGVSDAKAFPESDRVTNIKQGERIGNVLKLESGGSDVSHLHFGISTKPLVDDTGKLKSDFLNGGWGDTHYKEGNTASLDTAINEAKQDGWIDPTSQSFTFTK